MNDNETGNAEAPQELLLRADEVDAGTTVLSPSGQRPLSALDEAGSSGTNTARPKPPPRPALRRDGSAPPPPPPSQPPPAPPEQLDTITDSLSLPQLRQLVSQFPKIEQRAYAFNYQDAEDFVTEIDEWFHYTSLEQDRDYLLPAQEAFQEKWEYLFPTHPDADELTWIDASDENRSEFLGALSDDFDSDDITTRSRALAAVLYIVTGVWGLTAGLDPPSTVDNHENVPISNVLQVQMMHENVDIIIETGILNLVYSNLRNALDRPLSEATGKSHQDTEYEGVFDDSQFCEMSLAFSIFYIVVESARARLDSTDGIKARQALLKAEPNFLAFLTQTIARLRWDESYNIPLMHALQLLWKAVLLSFGDVKNHLEKVKSTLQPRVDPFSADACKPILTASPLDYHLFRQEITSKYPAYNPPLPLIPLEIEHKTILPPLPHQQNRPELIDLRSKGNVTSGSIMHQPVHIATPAPSPPPSPGGPGGKGGKKQNYQTNQNFPFLYPPLDSASNNIGGKGSTADQDVAVGRKWEGSDIPASIIEAGELFASRMRMTRAMRQLWHERDLFMKYDRGWKTNAELQKDEAQDGDDLLGNDRLQNPDLQQRMDAVEAYFHDALPDLQSLVIVMMKVMLTNVQDIAARNGQFQDNQPQTSLHRSKSNSNLNNAPNSLPVPPSPPRPNEISLEDLDNIRSRETSQKAISACLFLLLKWFKISHILKFEYITQLLLDSNYIQLTLKYFAHQNLEDLVSFKYDRDDLSFWRYCQVHSDHPPLSPTSVDQPSDHDSEDDAIPPPIQRHRRSPTSNSDGQQQPTVTITQQPIVDELGNPLTDLPTSPITTFSSRQFHTSISLLRVLQKLTRSKSHRVLLLVQFKSSQILRRVLRVPEPMLRLYVLKLFKSQVPYCGRKWRQSNMRVITAIYLHCRPELRDEWLAGMHDNNMEGEVEEAVPLEWSLRGLTFWWQRRVYGDVLKLKAKRRKELKGTDDEDEEDDEGGQEIDGEERDFFQRELDAMGWGLAALGLGSEDGVGFGEEAPGVVGEVNGGGVNGQGWDMASASPGYATVSPLEGWQ